MPIDQAHEQNNALVKGSGGAIGLTENPSAFRKWMIAGPEQACLLKEFEQEFRTNRNTMKKVTAHRKVSRSKSRISLIPSMRWATLFWMILPSFWALIQEMLLMSLWWIQFVLWRQLARKNIEPTVNLLSRIALALYMTQLKKLLTTFPTSDAQGQE